MSEHETEATQQDEVTEYAGAYYDAPNQQTVRADGSAPWDEGTGGTPGAGTQEERAPSAGNEPSTDLDAMTKEDLLTHARSLGVSPANATMTKEELREAIEAQQEEEAAR